MRDAKGSAGEFAIGLVVFVLSLGTLVESVRMPFYAPGTRGLLGSPGLTPAVLSIGLLLMSVALMLRNRRWSPPMRRVQAAPMAWRVGLLFALAAVYAYSMPFVGYTVATFVTLAVFQVMFGWRRSLVYIALVILLSAVLAVALKWLFTGFFFIPLPGERLT